MKGGGAGARLGGIVYDPVLTLDLPRAETVGTAMNALAHCAEALYSAGRNEAADREALAGAKLISEWLEPVLADGSDRAARKHLLEGALHAGAALAGAGLALGHAMAQTVGGRYGLPHGAMNALCLPAALRFNSEVAAAEIARFGSAMGADDPVERVVQLARLGGFERLRDFDVPETDLRELGDIAAGRPGTRMNPRPASPAEITELFRSIW